MNGESGSSIPRLGTSSCIYLGSLYFVSVGVLYIWGYWQTFGINVLEYMNPTDVLRLAAYPIASSFIFVVLGTVLNEFGGLHEALPPGGGRDTRTGRFLRKHARLIVGSYFALSLGLLFVGPVTKWLFLPVLIAIPVAFAVKRRGVFSSWLTNDSVRTVIIFLLAMLPPYAYGLGKIKAAELLNGIEYQYVAAGPVEGLTVQDPTKPSDRIKYLGHVNEYIFLLMPDNDTSVVLRLDKFHPLQLRRFRAGNKGLL